MKNFDDIAEEIIPGYRLAQAKQGVFLNSTIGQKFASAVNELVQLINAQEAKHSSSRQDVSSFVSYLFTDTGYTQKTGPLIEKRKKAILEEIQNSLSYKNLIDSIIYSYLLNSPDLFPDFHFLDEPQKLILAQADFSRPLQSELLAHGEKKDLSSFPDLIRSKVLEKWHHQFNTRADMKPLRLSIISKKANLRIKELEEIFPIYAFSKKTGEYTRLYREEYKKKDRNFDLMEQRFLTDILLHYMNQSSARHLKEFKVKEFNKTSAKKMAKKILSLSKSTERKDLIFNELFSDYQKGLKNHLINQLTAVNGHQWKKEKINNWGESWVRSLAYQFSQFKVTKEVSNFFRRYARAHAAIQGTGFATQNEHSWFATLDLINYVDSVEHVNSLFTILSSLLQPFQPLYEEYYEIAKMEQSNARKLFRAMMPLLILTAVVVIVGLLATFLALPEFAFIVLLIPTFIIGLFLAAKYVSLKNEACKIIYEYYYDGPYGIPEFQVNKRMETIFGNSEKAELIRIIYIEELIRCDELENNYSKKAEEGLLTSMEVKLRRENMLLRASLISEWYDIHSNFNPNPNAPENDDFYLEIDKVPIIVLNRLYEIGNRESELILIDLKENDLEKIDNCLEDFRKELQYILIDPGNQNIQNQYSEKLKINHKEIKSDKNRFFQTSERRDYLEQIDTALAFVRV